MNLEKKQKVKKRRKNNFLFHFVKITGAIPTLCWLRPKIMYLGEKGKQKTRGVLVCSNHIGWTDPIILHCAFWYRNLHCLAMQEIFKGKFKDFFFRQMNCIPVDRKNFSLNSFHDVCDNLKEGKAVLIFPEGKINNEVANSTLSFKSGAVLMAYQANVPILPVCILPIKKWYNRRIVLMGDLIDVRAICGERPSLDNINLATKMVKEMEDKLLEKFKQRNFGGVGENVECVQ